MTAWRPTAALVRSVLVAAVALVGGVVLGSPAVLVLAAPLAVCAVLGLVHRPRSHPAAAVDVDHRTLHEGQGTVSRLHLAGAAGAEHVTRAAGRAAYVALHPAGGAVGALVRPTADGAATGPVLEVGPRRWAGVACRTRRSR